MKKNCDKMFISIAQSILRRNCIKILLENRKTKEKNRNKNVFKEITK